MTLVESARQELALKLPSSTIAYLRPRNNCRIRTFINDRQRHQASVGVADAAGIEKSIDFASSPIEKEHIAVGGTSRGRSPNAALDKRSGNHLTDHLPFISA